MQFVVDLWVPILISALACWVISAISWAALPFHNRQWHKLPNEDAVADALRAGISGAGLYSVPHAGAEGAKSPGLNEKMAKGPIAFITVLPTGMPSMGKMMALSVLYNVVVSVFIAYIASHTLAAGAEYLTVFRVTGTVAFMAHAMASVPDSIWFGKPWSSYGLQLVDALAYSLVVGGVFGWRWV